MKKDIDVVLVTYNQKKYISQAIESILSQLNVSFRILIHDDFSTDGTRQIIEEYQKKYPDLIVPIFEKERTFIKLGFNKMIFNQIVPYIKADYVAYCDGDDYWCDNYKLYKQFEFMNKHNDYSLCCSSSFCLKSDGSLKSKRFFCREGDISPDLILSDKDGIAIATSTVFIKSNIFSDFPEWRILFPVEDFPMYLNAMINGKIHIFEKPMSVYRIFSDGSWSSMMNNNELRMNNLLMLKKGIIQFDLKTSGKYHHLIENLLNFYSFKFAYYKKDIKSMRLKKYKKYYSRLPFKEKFSYFLQYKMHWFYCFLRKLKKA